MPQPGSLSTLIEPPWNGSGFARCIWNCYRPQQKNSLEEDLAGAIRRVYAVKQTDQGPEANAAIDQLRKSGDLSQLQAFLTEERDRHTDDDQESRLQRDREIAAVAFLRGDTNGALDANKEILKVQPDDIDAFATRMFIGGEGIWKPLMTLAGGF